MHHDQIMYSVMLHGMERWLLVLLLHSDIRGQHDNLLAYSLQVIPVSNERQSSSVLQCVAMGLSEPLNNVMMVIRLMAMDVVRAVSSNLDIVVMANPVYVIVLLSLLPIKHLSSNLMVADDLLRLTLQLVRLLSLQSLLLIAWRMLYEYLAIRR